MKKKFEVKFKEDSKTVTALVHADSYLNIFDVVDLDQNAITSIKRSDIEDVIGDLEQSTFYLVKAKVTFDEKPVPKKYLVGAGDTDSVQKLVEGFIDAMDYEITGINLSPITEVVE